MESMEKRLVMFGSALMLIAVVLGAFGAHALAEHFAANPGRADTYDTAVQYHMVHALALLITAWASTRVQSRLIAWAGGMFVAGIFLFSGSLYLLAISGAGWLGAIAPFGGAAFVIGWALLVLGAERG